MDANEHLIGVRSRLHDVLEAKDLGGPYRSKVTALTVPPTFEASCLDKL